MGYEYYVEGELRLDPPLPARDWVRPLNKWSHFAALDHNGEPDDERGPWWALFPVQSEDGSIATVRVHDWNKSATWFGIIEELVVDVATARRFRDDRRTVTGRLTATGEDGDEFTIAVTDNHVTQLYTTLHGEDADSVDHLIKSIREDLKAARATGTLILPKGARITIARSGDGLEIRLGQLQDDWAWEWRYTSAIDNRQDAFATADLIRALNTIQRLAKHHFDPEEAEADALRIFALKPPTRLPALNR